MIDSVTGVILAGGQSTRMGKNKALLPYQGKTFLAVSIEKLSAIFTEVLLSVRDPNDYSDYPLQKVRDLYADIGPMGGIYSVLKSGHKRIFCVACDMPFLNPRLIEYLCEDSEHDAVIPVWDGRAEVLHAVYSQSLLPLLQAAIEAGRYKVTDALAGTRVRYLTGPEIRAFDPSGETFKNVNTPMDYEKL